MVLLLKIVLVLEWNFSLVYSESYELFKSCVALNLVSSANNLIQ